LKYRVLLLLLLLPALSFAQERGIGLRLGEPLSLTYKDFIEDYLSYEVMIGMAGVNSSDYYRKDFESNPPSSNTFYQSHTASKGVSINARVALNEDITDVFEITQGYLLAYGGAGIQIRTTNVKYNYFQNIASSATQPLLTDDRTNFDFGPEAFAGAEYYFDDTPISVFAEVGVYLELIDRINVKGQGGIGIRYLF
jgi:opacity protein-like surface antigen